MSPLPARLPHRDLEVSVAPIRARDALVVDAPVDAVWAALTTLDDYHRWWPWPLRIATWSCTPALVDSWYEVQPLAAPGFVCRVEAVDAPRRLRVRYDRGPYAGVGEWEVDADGPARTRVGYAVDLTTTHALLSPLGRVVSLGTLHSFVMGGVLAALARESARRASVPR